ncbi:MAG: bifunctional adenosylcobinamide kinase/adenosylcobinamide-phosphate guanylyltransferase [Desulfobacteraceae bacterium]|nr:bifunctional adenosylcobinamide kinase/adenosylcobinamide-phosphate guanylyltransferase [Desulfobacteraceae bacterium]
MNSHTLVLGGARSGKSAYALGLANAYIKKDTESGVSKGLYVATAQALDEEMRKRIEAHRLERGDGWETVEEPVEVPAVIRDRSGACPVILVDCLTLWVSNLLHASPDILDQKMDGLVHAVSASKAPVILVSNEVGLGLVPDTAIGRRFRDNAGRLHQALSRVCGSVFFVMAGLPLRLK